MRPAMAFLAGALLIWIVANGKAAAVWQAIAGTTSNPTRPPDPTTGTPPGGIAAPGNPPVRTA